MNAYEITKYTIFGVLGVLVLLLFIVLITPQESIDRVQTEIIGGEDNSCVRTSDITSIQFSGCYDAFSKFIYFETKNVNHFQSQTKVKVAFFDYSQQSYDLNVPEVNESSFIKLAASRNPLSLEIYLSGGGTKYCSVPLDLPIGYCPADLSDSTQSTSLDLITSTKVENFTSVSSNTGDTFSENIVDPESVWQAVCGSSWNCGQWGECIDGLEKRECTDLNECTIPTSVPRRVRTCNSECTEDWTCEWSECRNGFTTPSCVDQNSCGTSQNKPQRVSCTGICEPNIICGDWQTCEADYDFGTLSGGDISLSGIRERTCTDLNGCVPETKEETSCSLTVDIYTRSFTKCSKEYVGVYNSLDNSLLANIEKSEQKDQINIDLSGDESKFYCDYCFNGIRDGDEEQIDCGGSCPACSERRVDTSYSQNRFERIIDSILNFLS